MISQESIYTDTALSDFSSALLRANSNDQDIDTTGERSVPVSSNEYSSAGNRNLSSVLSQIQDDGPAYDGSDTSKPDNLLNLVTNKNDRSASTSINQQNSESNKTELNQEAVQDYSTNELLRKAMLSADDTEERSKSSSWPQMLLMLFVAIVSVASLVMIYTKTNAMEATLNLYDARIKDSEASKNIELSPKIMSINETLQSVQQELQLIKTDNPASVDNRVPAQSNEAVAINENVSALEDEILILKSELNTANKKLKAKDNADSTAKKVASMNLASTKLEGWVVNLASFTNKNSAQKKAEQLSAAGLSPSLQQAVVKGSQVYRLSVGGFENRSDAELFIREAGDKYGLKNGWVRKG